MEKAQAREYLILSLIPYKVLPANTGGQRAIFFFEQYLAAHVPLLAVTVRSNDPALSAGMDMQNILPDSTLRYINPFLYFRIARLIRRHKVKYVMLEHPYWGWLGWLLQKFTGVRLVIRSHNIEAFRWKGLGKWWWTILEKYEGFIHRIAYHSFFIQEADRQTAIAHYDVLPERCSTITYGTLQAAAPSREEKQAARKQLLDTYGLPENTVLFLFNGALSYAPNAAAVKTIVTEIAPKLTAMKQTYKIIICGKGLADDIQSLLLQQPQHFIYTGFVEDIDLYFKGADVFINPVTDGGGIKTKLVEALAWNTPSVSSVSGAIGVPAEKTGTQLSIVADNDWASFAQQMIMMADNTGTTPAAFYDYFYWDNIAQHAAARLPR